MKKWSTGYPGKERLHNGDLVAIDVGVKKNGFYGDAARSYKIGKVSKTAEKLWKATGEALDMAIDLCNARKQAVRYIPLHRE